MEERGRIHSFQSMGAVDGPGLRFVVFFQGCPLRCAYCHNPDTWDFAGGTESTAAQVVERALRCRGYFGPQGGVTLTGGEPLAQPEFAAEILARLQSQGVHTALDTAGAGDPARFEQVLRHTDLLLADVKFLTAQEYGAHCGGGYGGMTALLELARDMGVPLWIRHVVVPGLTDGREHLKALYRMAHAYPNLEKVELLPFRKLCLEKYEALGIPFPLEDTPEMEQGRLDRLLMDIKSDGF